MKIVFVIKLLLLLAVSVVSPAADSIPPVFTLAIPHPEKVKTCSGYTELYSPAHMNIGVKLNIVEVDAELAFMEAMRYWSATLDMNYSGNEDLNTCVIELAYAPAKNPEYSAEEMETILAYTHSPLSPEFDGVIYWNNKFTDDDGQLTKQELVSVFIHELGHLFGAVHNRDARSVMYWNAAYAGKLLLVSDLLEISEYHELRRAIRQARQMESTEK